MQITESERRNATIIGAVLIIIGFIPLFIEVINADLIETDLVNAAGFGLIFLGMFLIILSSKTKKK
jgi:hypothetical protein